MNHNSILYLECRSGISGDMFAGALLDLGADEAALRRALASLPLTGYELKIYRTSRAGLDSCRFQVITEAEPDHEHGHDHDHDHDHDPGHDHPHAPHHHRKLAEIRKILEAGALTPGARELALKIFTLLAEAEGRAHGIAPEEVHFHEVGAVDSIVDTVAAAVLYESLGSPPVAVSELCEGSGVCRCQHGMLPLPVPAVLNLAAAAGLRLKLTKAPHELVTPTGAAIAAALVSTTLPSGFRVERVGLGAGRRDPEQANVLRAMLIAPSLPAEEILVVETNLDDATGEQLGLALERLFAAGARDVHYLPVFMKKNRPGWLLRVIADRARLPEIERTIFEHTTAIGLRKFPVERTRLEREVRGVELPCGAVQVKISRFGEHRIIHPEFESVRALGEKTGVAFAELYQAAREAAERALES